MLIKNHSVFLFFRFHSTLRLALGGRLPCTFHPPEGSTIHSMEEHSGFLYYISSSSLFLSLSCEYARTCVCVCGCVFLRACMSVFVCVCTCVFKIEKKARDTMSVCVTKERTDNRMDRWMDGLVSKLTDGRTDLYTNSQTDG